MSSNAVANSAELLKYLVTDISYMGHGLIIVWNLLSKLPVSERLMSTYGSMDLILKILIVQRVST